MPQPDDLLIERSTDLDMDVQELWTLISTADGWSSWLVDNADMVVGPDKGGTVINDGVERSVRFDSIIDGRGIDFSWWDRGDPSSTSSVQLAIVELPNGRSQLNITERFIGATSSATASTSSMSLSVALTWQVRLVALWLLASQSTVMA